MARRYFLPTEVVQAGEQLYREIVQADKALAATQRDLDDLAHRRDFTKPRAEDSFPMPGHRKSGGLRREEDPR